jgi:curved DNA-binding protein CbpA
MTDYFALLQQQRRPWLDSAALKEAYLKLSKEVHPDKSFQTEGAASAELNAAYQCLRSSRTRILHLIELETGSHPEAVQAIPPELSDFFMRMTRAMRESDAFLRQWSTATGLVKAQMFEEAQEWVEKLQALQGEINARVTEAKRDLGTLDEQWEASGTATVPRLLDVYHLLSYYGRWSNQVQERLTRLAI